MNQIFPYTDIAYGTVIYVIIALLSLRKTPINIRNLFIVQLIVLYVLLLFIHIYAFYNYKTFPGLGGDSLLYDKLANYLSQQYLNGIIDLGFKNYQNFHLTGYRVNYHGMVGGHVPYGFVIPHSIIYYIFGYMPFVAKVFNVYAFHFASKYFYNLLNYYKIDFKIAKQTLILFAFFPPLMISSFSFVKESLFMLSFVAFVYYIVKQKPSKAFVWFVISALIRPYTPIVFIFVYLIYNRRILIQQFGKYTVLLLVSFMFFSFFSFQAFNITKYFSETSYTIYYDPGNLDKFETVDGVFNILLLVLKSPLMFLKYFAFGIFWALFKPDPFHIQISNLFYGKAYTNGGEFSFSTLAYTLYAFILYFLHFTFIKYILNKKHYKGIGIKFDVAYVFIMITVIIFIRGAELRYFVMSTYPFALLIYAKIKNVRFRIPNSNTYIVYTIMIIGELMASFVYKSFLM